VIQTELGSWSDTEAGPNDWGAEELSNDAVRQQLKRQRAAERQARRAHQEQLRANQHRTVQLGTKMS